MASTEIYEHARERLNERWDEARRSPPSLDPAITESIAVALDSPENSQRYAVVTQLLRKAMFPALDATSTVAEGGAPSARALAKNVVAPFDSERGAPLGGSTDPYVSNPLRRHTLNGQVKDGSSTITEWQAVLDILAAVNETPELADAALAHALDGMRRRTHSLRSLLNRVMELQALGADSRTRSQRKELVESVAPRLIQRLVLSGLSVDSSTGSGTDVEVPWIRVFSPAHSPSAQEGWYLSYLFAADGSVVYLSLMHGVAHATASDADTQEAARRFRERGDFVDSVDLKSTQASPTARPHQYERATALAIAYPRDRLPDGDALAAHLEHMSGLLFELYSETRPGEGDIHALTLEGVLRELASEEVELPTALVKAAVAAVRAGQHVLFVGPPGTGKTSLAVALARAAQTAGVASGFETVTATADWTAADTVGGYWPEPDGATLAFRSGAILAAIESRQWIIIDELNRADVDKALGPLFTVLSGRVVRLPHLERIGDELVPVEITPAEEADRALPSARRIVPSWRMLATLNTRDRDLLFNLSYALLRRFAIIDVGVPDDDQYATILAARAPTGDDVLDSRLLELSRLPHRKLGPAILIDCGRFLRERSSLDETPANDRAGLFSEAITAFVLPQLDDLTRTQQADVVRFLQRYVLPEWSLAQVQTSVGLAFDLPADILQSPTEELAGALDSEGPGPMV